MTRGRRISRGILFIAAGLNLWLAFYTAGALMPLLMAIGAWVFGSVGILLGALELEKAVDE